MRSLELDSLASTVVVLVSFKCCVLMERHTYRRRGMF